MSIPAGGGSSLKGLALGLLTGSDSLPMHVVLSALHEASQGHCCVVVMGGCTYAEITVLNMRHNAFPSLPC